MRCNICNTILEPTQIRQDKHGEWMPCPKCVTEAWLSNTEDGRVELDDEDMEFFMSDMDAAGYTPDE